MLPKKKFQGGWGKFEGGRETLFQKGALSPSQAIPMPIKNGPFPAGNGPFDML